MAENLPADKYGTVIGQFKVIQIDSDSDFDQYPDFLPARGTVVFKASIPYVQDIQGGGGQSITYLKTEIRAVLDQYGNLSTGVRDPNTGELEIGVRLLATDNTALTPHSWTYQVTFSLTSDTGDFAGSIKPFSFSLPGGVTKDLTDMIPVTTSNGIPVIHGDKGDTGPMGPGVYVSDVDPQMTSPGMWVQTGLGDGSDFTIWIENGL